VFPNDQLTPPSAPAGRRPEKVLLGDQGWAVTEIGSCAGDRVRGAQTEGRRLAGADLAYYVLIGTSQAASGAQREVTQDCTCYCMRMLERRVHILLDDARYRRVAAAARERKTSVAAVIRDALDRTLAVEPERKRRAADELLAAEPAPVPETVEELKAELRAGRGW
jgi:hypothetical protein